MRKRLLFAIFMGLVAFIANAQEDGILHEETNYYVCFEAENPFEDNGNIAATGNPIWLPKTDNPNFTGTGHLEFNGNGESGGAASAPLQYQFKITHGGQYYMYIRCRKRLDGAESDKCNDGFVKMAGDFEAAPGAALAANKPAPLDILKGNNKFFGGPGNGWGYANMIDKKTTGNDYKIKPIYVFKDGETYTLTISGRSIRWNIDRIILVHLNHFSKNDVDTKGHLLPVTSTPSADTDGDGVIDAVDNCVDNPNADQLDVDKDGVGDVCDTDICGYVLEAHVDFPQFTNLPGFVNAARENGRKAMSINTVLMPADEWAAAKTTFKGTAGTYDMVFTTLLETDGECSYKIKINDEYVAEFKNPRIYGTATTDYSEYTVEFPGVEVPENATIQIEFLSHSNGLVPEGDGFAYARARWRRLSFGTCEDGVVLNPDMDGDGIENLLDNCPNTPNADQLDSDGDGVGDVCDADDRDGDTVKDDVDNCPDTANADQADTDSDGIGNVCDICPDAADPDQFDRDGDGFGDACDPEPDVPACTNSPAVSGGNGAGSGQTPYSLAPASIVSGTKLFAVYYDEGGEGVAYHDLDGFNVWTGTQARTTESVDNIDKDGDGIPETAKTEVREWLEYTVDFAATGKYEVKISAACKNPGKYYLKIDNKEVTCINAIPSTGNLKTYGISTAEETIDIQKGKHVFAIVFESADVNVNFFEFNKVGGISTGIGEVPCKASKVSPNPFSDELRVDSNASSIGLYTLGGTKLSVPVRSSAMGVIMNTSHLTQGMYLLKVGGETMKVLKK